MTTKPPGRSSKIFGQIAGALILTALTALVLSGITALVIMIWRAVL
ncbi:hypothetical protein NSA19_03810 [Actinomyces bowdenii]|nr:hypothetical protein [Actinomyces bowdenii]MCR2051993.1 hypothetical protein [Actinomyces bowdenii]